MREHRDARTTAKQRLARCNPKRLRRAVGPRATSLKSRQQCDTDMVDVASDITVRLSHSLSAAVSNPGDVYVVDGGKRHVVRLEGVRCSYEFC